MNKLDTTLIRTRSRSQIDSAAKRLAYRLPLIAMSPKVILVMGLPGSGKTTLAKKLATALSAIHLNADAIRQSISRDLSFSHEDRIEQARRMGRLSREAISSGHTVITDFVCPTDATRAAFFAEVGKPIFMIWMNTISQSRYEDTNKMFVPPTHTDMTITSFDQSTVSYVAARTAMARVNDTKHPISAEMIDRIDPIGCAS